MVAPIPLKFPPGLYKNGTSYSRKGRWGDANLVRWHDGSVRPVGGWSRRQTNAGADITSPITTPADEAIRDIFSWRDNDQDQNTVFGSNLAVYHMDVLGAITDITPAGYTATNASKDPSTVAGYGQNPFGYGAYGSANALTGADITPPNRWFFTNFGEILVFGSRNNGALAEYDPNSGVTSAVSNAPSDIQDAIVTSSRQVMTLGGGGEPRRVQTSEIEDRTNWTAAVNNQVIDRTLPGTGRLLRLANVIGVTLILGENDAHVARYVGPPYVYGIDLAGNSCGPLAAEALAYTERLAVWWGKRNFWLYDGTVKVLECEIMDYLVNDIDDGQVSKICAFANTAFSEIWWLYQSESSTTGEVDSYAIWNYKDNTWNCGRISRTAGTDRGVLSSVVMVDPDGNIYNHELSGVLPDVGDIYITTGPVDIAEGDQNVAVQFIYPDTESTNDVTFTLKMRQFPTDTEYDYGPYSFNNPVPTTGALGRTCRLRCDFQQVLSEVGVNRLVIANPRTGTGRR